MSFDPDNYELSIRGVEPTYNHTLDRTAGRKTSHETHLSSVDVVVQLRAGRGKGDYNQTFVAEFAVDHDAGAVTFKTVGDEHERRTEFDPEKFWYVSHFAAEVVTEWLFDIGLDYTPPKQSVTPQCEKPPNPTVHTELDIVSKEDRL